MKVAHFDCFSGISGDMTLAALIDVGVDVKAIRAGIASMGLPIEVVVEKVRKGGFAATQVFIEAPKEDEHRFLPDIEAILDRAEISQAQRELARKIFHRLAEAEAAAHGLPLERVHFHEVGALDSIADIVGSAIGLDLLGVSQFTSRAVPTGTGMVKCAHGLMPIPAPATANLLKGVPIASSTIKGELTTPTGAAILTSVVSAWIDGPSLTIERIGHGAGRREFVEQPNLLRLFVGDAVNRRRDDTVFVLETNLDDMPAEWIGYCQERLLAAGALDVYCVPIQMKKNRPGVMLGVLAPESGIDAMEAILFAETTTFGIRRYAVARDKRERRICRVQTKWGPVFGKLGSRDGSADVFGPEYESCARIAREQKVPLREVYDEVHLAFRQHGLMPDMD